MNFRSKYYKNNKGISELISFVLILFIIIISSIIAYEFSQNYLEKHLIKSEFDNMKINFKKIQNQLINNQNFQDSTFSYNLNLNYGKLYFKQNQLIYYSLLKIGDFNKICFNELCYLGVNGYEQIYFNLSDSYEFKNDFELGNGNYNLIFTNIKNETKIDVKIK